MRPVVDIARTAQAALRLDPFSVWVYEIGADGVECWRPAGFTPAEWEVLQQSAFAELLPVDPHHGVLIFDAIATAIQTVTDTLFEGLAPALASFGESMQQLVDSMGQIGIDASTTDDRSVACPGA